MELDDDDGGSTDVEDDGVETVYRNLINNNGESSSGRSSDEEDNDDGETGDKNNDGRSSSNTDENGKDEEKKKDDDGTQILKSRGDDNGVAGEILDCSMGEEINEIERMEKVKNINPWKWGKDVEEEMTWEEMERLEEEIMAERIESILKQFAIEQIQHKETIQDKAWIEVPKDAVRTTQQSPATPTTVNTEPKSVEQLDQSCKILKTELELKRIKRVKRVSKPTMKMISLKKKKEEKERRGLQKRKDKKEMVMKRSTVNKTLTYENQTEDDEQEERERDKTIVTTSTGKAVDESSESGTNEDPDGGRTTWVNSLDEIEDTMEHKATSINSKSNIDNNNNSNDNDNNNIHNNNKETPAGFPSGEVQIINNINNIDKHNDNNDNGAGELYNEQNESTLEKSADKMVLKGGAIEETQKKIDQLHNELEEIKKKKECSAENGWCEEDNQMNADCDRTGLATNAVPDVDGDKNKNEANRPPTKSQVTEQRDHEGQPDGGKKKKKQERKNKIQKAEDRITNMEKTIDKKVKEMEACKQIINMKQQQRKEEMIPNEEYSEMIEDETQFEELKERLEKYSTIVKQQLDDIEGKNDLIRQLETTLRTRTETVLKIKDLAVMKEEKIRDLEGKISYLNEKMKKNCLSTVHNHTQTEDVELVEPVEKEETPDNADILGQTQAQGIIHQLPPMNKLGSKKQKVEAANRNAKEVNNHTEKPTNVAPSWGPKQ